MNAAYFRRQIGLLQNGPAGGSSGEPDLRPYGAMEKF